MSLIPERLLKTGNDHVYNNQTGHVGLTGGLLFTPYMTYMQKRNPVSVLVYHFKDIIMSVNIKPINQ